MGLKEEIQNLIATERGRLETRESKMDQFLSIQKARLTVLNSLLTELANAVSPEYVRTNLAEDAAEMSVGWNRPEDGAFETKLRWTITPNHQSKIDHEAGYAGLDPLAGFNVVETSFLAYEMDEQKRTFPNEESVIEHIAKKIATQVASAEHIKRKRGK
ncbi:hypothetical protein FBQ96_01905 [Nitrospirales bacterium NOB]|nr:hypothetical protein [Nitrospirales bacterium NOB]